jgi:hypothetical protein
MELGLCFSYGCRRRTIWIVDAHRSDGKRFVVQAEEKLTAFVELEKTRRANATKFLTDLRLRRFSLTSRRDFCQARRR